MKTIKLFKKNPKKTIKKFHPLSLLVLATVWIFPPTTKAATYPQIGPSTPLVFNTLEKTELQKLYGVTTARKNQLVESLNEYLSKRNSPLAECSEVIVEQSNWKKILSLANAESGLGRRFPKHTVNLWGVGGSQLWDFGDTVCEAVPKMNAFLENYPKRSKVKYADMPIEKMNGLYKQPYAKHWTINNNVILEDLEEMEQSLTGPKISDIEPAILAQK